MKAVILLGLIALFAQAQNNATITLTDEQIDKIFLSFVKEKKLKEEEKQKKINPPTYAGIPKNPTSVLSGNRVYGKSPINLNADMRGAKAFKINGVVCEGKECSFFTASKKYDVGDMLLPMEKILSITPHLVKTTLRNIKY